MLSRWPIRKKLLLGVAILFLIVGILAFSSFRGVYAYRQLARSISHERAMELRLAAQISLNVGELRAITSRVREPYEFTHSSFSQPIDLLAAREQFRNRFMALSEALTEYKSQLEAFEDSRPQQQKAEQPLPEWETVTSIERSLDKIEELNNDDDWALGGVEVADLDLALADVHTLALQLPFHLQERMQQFAGEVRGQYRIWIVLTWISSASTVVMMYFLMHFLNRALMRPFRLLLHGCRRVARDGDFQHRIRLNTHDEVAELGEAMNAMTDRFEKIRADLDRQVKERTKEVVRSEQLASVGFLAAGVAHEINNPLASIAWCAEALESRVYDIILEDDAHASDEQSEEIAILQNYLRKIQDEAFRCKGITERLLDYSRMGDVERLAADMHELVEGVIDMVRHLGKYREKRIDFQCNEYVTAPVNAQEMKQVVLNLLTNALDSLEAGGTVLVRLGRVGQQVELVVEDDGVGMTDEIIQHLYEPFYTRRRDGQGTGLGLSITYQIIQEHGGTIDAYSDGPGHGSTFRVTLPLEPKSEISHDQKYKVA